jgi:hypothetical protein
MRCELSAAAFNVGPNLHSVVHKKMTEKSSGFYTKKYKSANQERKESRSKRRLVFNCVPHRKRIRVCGPDEHYGANAPESI